MPDDVVPDVEVVEPPAPEDDPEPVLEEDAGQTFAIAARVRGPTLPAPESFAEEMMCASSCHCVTACCVNVPKYPVT